MMLLLLAYLLYVAIGATFFILWLRTISHYVEPRDVFFGALTSLTVGGVAMPILYLNERNKGWWRKTIYTFKK